MATIAPGQDGSFKAVTAEGRLIEALIYLSSQEKIEVKNPTARTSISGRFSVDEEVFAGTYNLPAQQSIETDGGLRIVASPYLLNAAVTPGSGTPTFKSTSPEAYVLECLMYLQGLERNPVKNPNNSNFISGTFNSDSGFYQGSFSLPVAVSLSSTGAANFVAQEYLLT